jgi:hydrogenase maturation factor
MCIEQLGQVVAVPEAEEAVAIVEIRGSLRRVSLALLVLDGVEVNPGDWLQSHTGLAVRVLPEGEALELAAEIDVIQGAADPAPVTPGEAS